VIFLVFTFVWTAFHTTPDALTVIGIILAILFLRAGFGDYEWNKQ
jgi:hypothetical protein